MITGAHSIIYSKDAEADRAFLRDTLGLAFVDVGHGWLIFRLPPAELAVHPSSEGQSQELFLMCEDIERFMERMGQAGRACDPAQSLAWGTMTYVTLPSGAKIGVYRPRHATPAAA
jgi:hypothetical protein